MIPETNITAWSQHAPWGEPRQIEQDLIISRALVEIFNHELLGTALRFRGGTALNKLIFPAPLRYSEDIDLVRTEAGPIGPVLDALRDVLENWLGKGSFVASQVAPKLRFRVPSEEDPQVPIRLKVEINIAETQALDRPVSLPFAVVNPWFNGVASVASFTPEELLATKLRALLQRDKGRDLFDLDHALAVLPELDVARVIAMFGKYVRLGSVEISRAQAEERMLAKFARRNLLSDMRPLLPPKLADALDEAAARATFLRVFTRLIDHIPGERWARRDEIAERLGLLELVA